MTWSFWGGPCCLQLCNILGDKSNKPHNQRLAYKLVDFCNSFYKVKINTPSRIEAQTVLRYVSYWNNSFKAIFATWKQLHPGRLCFQGQLELYITKQQPRLQSKYISNYSTDKLYIRGYKFLPSRHELFCFWLFLLLFCNTSRKPHSCLTTDTW